MTTKRRRKNEAPSKMTQRWKEQDVNDISELEVHRCRLPNDFTDWSKLSGKVVPVEMTKEELDEYLSKRSK